MNADVTPSIATFTYTENDVRGGPVGSLVFAGLDFTLAALDATTGAPVTAFADPPLATIVYRQSDLQSARIGDPSALSLYWWSGTAWVNQHGGLHPLAPFGGVKCSGIGVEFNVDGLKEYTTIQVVNVAR